jgi:alpha-D-xyloside xylohydrolase
MGFIYEEKGSLNYEYNGEILKIEPWGDNSFRVRCIPNGMMIDTDYALLKVEECHAEIQIIDEDTVLEDGSSSHINRGEITNGKLKAVIHVDNWSKQGNISFYNQKGELLLKERGVCGALHLKARFFKPIIGGNYQLNVTFESNSEEKLFGMGQYQQDLLNIKFCSFELAHRNSQASIPFVLSSLGYGFLWHNPAIGRASFLKNQTLWEAESTKMMDYWITAGDSPKEIEQAYANVTGKVPMMPEYGLGFWQCKLRYWNQKQLLEVAREYKRREIPVDVIVCDFFHWPKMGDFRFEEEFFPDPDEMVRQLKELGTELMVSVWPQIDLESENFKEMLEKGLLVKTEKGVNVCMRFGGDSVFFDATNPKAREYVWNKCKNHYYKKGIQIFWLDEAEPEYGEYDFDNYRYYIGPNVQIGNVYPQMFSRAFYDGMQEEGMEKIVNLVRCAWAGSQRYGALVWSGDIDSNYETLRRQVSIGLNMGISGIPWWTTDIGGFTGGNPKDKRFQRLLVRWFQWGTFCPVMRLHGDRYPSEQLFYKDGRPYLFTGADNEIWSYGEENYEILKKYILFREAMRSYTRSLMKEAHEKGHPVIRTMFYEFPEDEMCWQLQEQYMYGEDMLIAPMLYEDIYDREVYLPQNIEWKNIHNGMIHQGGQMIKVHAEIDEIPVFIRNGKLEELIGLI